MVQRRARHQLARAQAREHVVQGYLLALQQLEAVVEAIRAADDAAAARAALVGRFGLSAEQAEAVLNLTLRWVSRGLPAFLAIMGMPLRRGAHALTRTGVWLEQALQDKQPRAAGVTCQLPHHRPHLT